MIRTAIFTLLLLIIPETLVVFAQQADSSIERVDTSSISQPLEHPVKYNAQDSTVMELDANRIKLYGNASVEYGELKLEAHYIEFTLSDFTARASGKKDSTGFIIQRAKFSDGQNSIEEDSLSYNFNSRRGISYGARTQDGDAYLISTLSKKAENEWISIRKGKMTTCNAENPHYHFHLSRALAIPNDRVVSGPLYLKFRKIPTPLALPFGFFPNKKESSQGILLPGYGNGDEKGFFIQNLGYYVPLGPYLDTKFLFDIYTRGSWAVRNVTSYKKRYKYSGNFNLSRVVNKDGMPELQNYSSTTNFNIQWNHSQDPKARPNSNFTANVNMGSINNFRNNLNTSQQDFLSSTFSSRVQYTQSFPGKPFSIGITAGHTQNTQSKTVQLSLPELSCNMSRITLGRFTPGRPVLKKFLDNFGLTSNAEITNQISAEDRYINWTQVPYLNRISRNGIRNQTQLSTSIRAAQYGTLTLSAGSSAIGTIKYLEQNYSDAEQSFQSDTAFGFKSAITWNVSANYNTRVYGTFNTSKTGLIRAVRHVLQWNLGVSHVPERTVTRDIYAPDGTFQGYNPFSLAAFSAGNTNRQINLNWSSTNNIEAKLRGENHKEKEMRKVTLLESWKKTLSYNLLADSLRMSNLGMTAFGTIAQKITLNYSSTYSVYDRDTLGRKIDRYLWHSGKAPLRMEGTNLALGFQLKSKEKKRSAPTASEETEPQMIDQNPEDFIDFSIPWRLNLRYNFRIDPTFDAATQVDKKTIKQALTFDGEFVLFKYWAISFNSGYDLGNARYEKLQWRDFGLRDFTTTNLGLHWDLHCWEFTFNFVPTGQRKSYMGQLNVKSSLLQDLKIQRRGNLGDQRYLY
jgi:hypothetical protein